MRFVASVNTLPFFFLSSLRLLLALVAMIFVNYGGGGYALFEHSPWHGLTFADVIFPLFVWICGVSLVFSLKNAFDRGVSKQTLLSKVAMRTLKLLVGSSLVRSTRI